ncbi:TonB-linked outer membrane protein, SusC/RagA family [Tannerella forsythia KS16]|jgi:TonB-linked outer membrane protein, SusC/RagA family/TonB-dependent outer membrane receptor, SusC/RagA subfamily, signature region|uniref:TonB-dependent receptor SusC n=2 Tax=Tannerella forsythia TaxID=28112 RepID=A0A1D3UWF8_TANFO|nr:TonB-dependent receptor [Tannerella forsythia]TPE18202.1 TonB-dependent receptor [Tannerella forsythia]BAR52868.1 TonB-linked outer membrane protein, SusC/RagA family [Tannerella forsythia KS16]SCQ23297.1 TonB-dependent receptor SusC [Tannerella forsythia]SCQ24333.1 TonB-dependent receptor SusC [Tannerella forsythia]
MRQKIFLLMASLLIGAGSVMAQTQVQGTVVDEQGEPVTGASIVLKTDRSKGTISDIDGKFTLWVPNGSTLVFSFVGFKTQEAVAQPDMKITLMGDTETLDEVIVVAYGTAKKSAFTGSASKVDAASLRESAAISPISALQGKAAGVTISESYGQPGSMPTIRIRGVGSITGNRSPLYVIDGIPVLAGDVTSTQTSASVLNLINPEDIESQTILKDAAATALYGSRGANGVVLITTKSGRRGKTHIAFTAEYGTSDFATPHALDYMDAGQYAQYTWESLKNKYLYDRKAMPEQAKADTYESLLPEAERYAYRNLAAASGLYHPDDPFDGTFNYKNMTPEQQKMFITNPRIVNWKDAIFKTGAVQKYDLSLNGGGDKTTYYVSFGYLKNDGLVQGSVFERFSGALSLNLKLHDRVLLKLSEKLSRARQDGALSNGSYYANPMFAYYGVNPSAPVTLSDGSYNNLAGFSNKFPNPILNQQMNERINKTMRSLTHIGLEITFTDWLKFTSTNGIDFIFSDDRRVIDPRSNDGLKEQGHLSRYKRDLWDLTTSNLLVFDKGFGKHHANILAGMEYKNYTSNRIGASTKTFGTYKLMYLSNGAVKDDISETIGDDRLISYLSKIDYNYDQKYFGSLSWRRDGSSRLSPDTRWGDFFSTSAAWVLSEEHFMKPIQWLDMLKLKLSYGTTGNLPTKYYSTLGLYSISEKYLGKPAFQLYQIENNILEWEKSYTWNGGFDFRIFERFSGTLEFYQKNTKGLINNSPLWWSTGFETYTENRGELENKGIELEFNSVNIETNDFKWSTQFNLTHYTSKIKKLDKPIDNFPYFYGEGDDMYTFKLREWAGVNAQTGQPQWYKNKEIKDANGNVTGIDRSLTSKASEAEKVKVGTGIPDFMGGLTNRFEYKGFDLSFLFIFKKGGKLYDPKSFNHTDGRTIGEYNIRKDSYGKHWQKPGDNAEYARLIYGAPDQGWNNSNRRLIDGSFIKLKNITFGYNLPKKWLSKASLSNVRLYFNATDIFTLFKKNYIDPEVPQSGYGFDYTDEFPPLRSFRFGININL